MFRVLKMLLTKFTFRKLNMSRIEGNILSQKGKCHGKIIKKGKTDGTLKLVKGFHRYFQDVSLTDQVFYVTCLRLESDIVKFIEDRMHLRATHLEGSNGVTCSGRI